MKASSIIFKITTFENIPKDEWNKLFLASCTGNLFYHRAFIKAAKASWPDKQADGFISGYIDERLVLLQPYKINTDVLGRVVELLQIPTADGIEPIVTGDNPEEILRAFLGFILNTLKPDLLLAYSLTRKFHVALNNYFPSASIRQGEQQKGHYMNLPDSIDEFWALYKSNFRSQLRKKLRIAKNTGLDFRIVEATQLPPGYDMEQAFETHTRLHNMRFDSMNRESFFLQPDFQTFHRHLCTHPDGPSCILTFTETVYEGKVIGSLYGVRAPHAYIYLMIGFNPEFASLSPGNLMLYYTIEDLIRHQVKLFDFKCGDEPYKLRWATETYDKFNVCVALTGNGQLLYLRHYSGLMYKKLLRAPRKLKRLIQSNL